MPRLKSYERTSQAFVKMHKEGLEKPPFVDIHPCKRAEIPIVKAIIMQFTILAHKSSVVKGFLQNILDIFFNLIKIDKSVIFTVRFLFRTGYSQSFFKISIENVFTN